MDRKSILDTNENNSDQPDKTSFYYVSNFALATLCALTVIAMGVTVVKVFQKVWLSDKVILLMLTFLMLSLLGKSSNIRGFIGLYLGGTAFFSLSNIRVYSHPWPIVDSPEEFCETTVFPYLPVVFLTCAVILNINKWIYCLMHINFYSHTAVTANQQAAHQVDLLKLTFKQQVLNFTTAGVIVLYCFYNLAFFLYGCLHVFE